MKKNYLQLAVLMLVLFGAVSRIHAQGGVMSKSLVDFSSPDISKQVSANGEQVTSTPGKDGMNVTIQAGQSDYPGLTIRPADGAAWNLALYGHVEARVTNTGDQKIPLYLRVDNAAQSAEGSWNCESKTIEPGQTKTILVYFGYSYGFFPGFKLKPEAVTSVVFFTGKTAKNLSFRIESLQGAGWVGEKVGVDPDLLATKPPGGILLSPSLPITAAAQISAGDGAKGSVGEDGRSLRADFPGGKQGAVTFMPSAGLWNLNEQLEVKITIKNVGQNPATPSARVESRAGYSDVVAAVKALTPGEETEIVIPFAARVPWKGVTDPEQVNPKAKGSWSNQPGTGTRFSSHVTSGVTVFSDASAGDKTLQISSIIADFPAGPDLPDWLGKRPPVDGDWVQTLSEEFDGEAIDLHRWNLYSPNYWDKRMHFSKDQVLVNDGNLTLRLEKKPGRHNDDPNGALTDYAAGQPDTFGKWTQRYGYFEIRQKQPTAKSVWPGLWMVPDRGVSSGLPREKRGSVRDGGMEIDITESQSSWGIHRFNVACHWDDYGEFHKSIGSSANYVQADKDGYIVVGLLWTPGSCVVYGNGKEIWRWESPRISNQQQFLILQNELGGWDNEAVDDAQLPADYLVDYIRVWQRKDLATPEDGAKPNQGGLDDKRPSAANNP